MDVVRVDALLLRSLMPDIALREGARFVARVAARAQGELGTLVLAGVPLTAQLPDEVAAGDVLRLTVQEVTAERILLRMDPPVAAPLPAPPPPPRPGMPPRVAVREPPRRSAAPDAVASVALSFESAALGRLDLRVELAAGAVHAAVAAPPGQSFELAGAAAEELRAALEAHVGRPAAVRVTARRDPVDLYA